MIKVRRIGHATFETPDLPRLIDYHTQVTGLALVGRDTDHVFFAARTGQLAVELRRATRARNAPSFALRSRPTRISPIWRAALRRWA